MIYSISSKFVPVSNFDQTSKKDSFGKQVRQLSTLLKERQVNALNRANIRTSDVNENQNRTLHAFVPIADGMVTLCNIVEGKRMMTNENAYTIDKFIIQSLYSSNITMREKDQVSDRKTITSPIPHSTVIPIKGMAVALASRIIETKTSTT